MRGTSVVPQAVSSRPPRVRFTISSLVLAGLVVAAAPAGAQVVDLTGVQAGAGGFLANGEAATDEAGVTVSSAGDVNGDGLADMLIGSSFADGSAGTNSGRTYVVFGSTSGTAPSLTAIAAGASSRGFVVNGQFAEERSAYSVSGAGDVNGDGLGDLIVGAPLSDEPPATTGDNRGRSYVVFGKSTPAPVNLTEIATSASTKGYVIVGEAGGDRAGNAVSAAGDVNGDGLGDVAVAAPLADPAGRVNAGRVYVVFGKTSGTTLNLASVSAGTGGFVVNGEDGDQPGNDFGDQAGRSVSAAGDANGDGLGDIVLGALRNDPLGRSNAGASYVIFGKSTTGAVELSAVAGGASTNGFAMLGQTAGDGSGRVVSGAGDVNGDGLGDVILGVPYSDPASLVAPFNFRGRSYVVFGKSTGSAVDLANVAAGTGGFAINGQQAGEYSGFSVSSAGDINGDGRSDVVVGADLSDPPGRDNAGRTYIVFGKSTTTAVALSALISGTSALGFSVIGANIGEQAGRSVAFGGDINGNGIGDLVIGAPSYDAPGPISNVGRAYALFSPLTPPTGVAVPYKARIAAGNPDAAGIGSAILGDDRTSFPASRLWVDFDSGSGPGPASSSEISVELVRDRLSLSTLSSGRVAPAYWAVTTNRTAWSEARVTIRYTEADYTGFFAEGELRLVGATSPGTAHIVLSDVAIDTTRNEISATVFGLLPQYLALVAPPEGDANLDGRQNVADLTAIHNLLAGITTPPLAGDGDVDDDGDIDLNDATALRNFLVNGTPLP